MLLTLLTVGVVELESGNIAESLLKSFAARQLSSSCLLVPNRGKVSIPEVDNNFDIATGKPTILSLVVSFCMNPFGFLDAFY